MAPNVWALGRAEVEQALRNGTLTRVDASRDLAEAMLEQARGAFSAAEMVTDVSVESAFNLLYDAARLALSAVLVNQGLKTRGEGAHAAVVDLVIAQTEPPRQEALRAVKWMRSVRNDTQYPNPDRPVASRDDFDDAVRHVPTVIERAGMLVQHMPPF
ncbi:HEPN domain-containing protein [Curtobacterium sp. VKM Ac-2865]|uniref:HEPN domain-containing protein n=1 Tax=Curtobacterium sp. VKM Ac-2865 TaxID=2783817 RepID=UPI00188CEEC2|nr:HEPN domain-containing protein [Curtobacterium sp. VKM Ac-2865]MBF4582191.1 HEPN domain-containing protein [Curtobacterium sp. VKM Ac-2865]